MRSLHALLLKNSLKFPTVFFSLISIRRVKYFVFLHLNASIQTYHVILNSIRLEYKLLKREEIILSWTLSFSGEGYISTKILKYNMENNGILTYIQNNFRRIYSCA